MSKNTVWVAFGGTNYYLSGGAATQTVYAGSGTPWTAESTTPYELALSENSGPVWTPTAPTPTRYTYGGPPFGIGAFPFAQSYGSVTESVGVLMRATTKDNAFFLLRQLRNVLDAAIGGGNVLLGVTGGTNTAYYQIIGAVMQENPAYIYELNATTNSSAHLIRATITWERSPFAGRLGGGETLINGVSFNNPDTEAFSTGAGDLIYEGSPCNYIVRPTSDPGIFGIRYVWLASVQSATTLTVSSGSPWSTTGTTYGTGASVRVADLNISAMITNPRLRVRLIATMSAATITNEYRFALRASGGSADIIYSPVISTTNGDNLVIERRIDSGPLPLSLLPLPTQGSALSSLFEVYLQVRSTTGGSATGTLTNVVALIYYDYCEIFIPSSTLWGDTSTTDYELTVASFAEYTGYAALPLPYPQATLTDPDTNDELAALAQIRGTVPRYYSGATLWMQAADIASDEIYIETRTFTVTATHAPLYRTLRAGG